MATQVVDLTKLPFVKSLLASIGPDISQEFQHSGPNAALGDTVDMSQQPQSRIPKYLLPSEMGPPAPLPDMQQQDTLPPPDLSAGQPPPPPPQPANPVQDLTQSMVQDQTAPNLRSAMYTANAGAAPTPTKANRLLQILRGGLTGGAAGAGQRTFGQGFQQAQTLPLEVQHMGLQNEQVRQLLPFLRAQNIAGLQKTSAEAQKSLAEAGKAQAEVEGMPIRQALERAQTEAAYYKEDQNLGLIDVRTGQPVNPSGMAPLSPEEAQVLGKQPGERVPLKLKNTANEIVNRGFTTVNTEEGVYERNRATGKQTRLGSNPRLVFAPSERFVPVVDPNNPGNVTYQKAGIAAQQGLQSPQSAPTQTARATARAMAPGGRVGEDINAFNTAMQHADLLQQALGALNNGDVRALNSLKNQLKTAFGSSDVTNFTTIAQAYTDEVQKMLASGHITEGEQKLVGGNLPSNASPQQILGALQKYRALAASKLQMRQTQVQQGLQGKAAFPTPQQHVIQIGNQHYQYKGTGATDDLRNYEPIQ